MQLATSFLGTFAAVLLVCMAGCASIRPGRFSIVDYGARGDGQTLNSAAIGEAITACSRSGGGTVVVPPGRFITGPIDLKSNIELHLEAGAVLEGTTDIARYESQGRLKGLITARESENVTVTGPGVIQGNGSAFMEPNTPQKWEHTTGRYSRQGEAFRTPGPDGPMAMRRRPGTLVLFAQCRNVLVRDVTLKDAPEWTVQLRECDVGRISGVRILNNPLIPNNDGIHCVTSRNIAISDCDVQAGDDAIAITGLAGRPGAMAENITVTNCTLMSRSSGVRVGYGSNTIRRCTFQNLVIRSSNRGLGVFVRDEGSITDILFSNIIIETRLHTGWWGHAEPIHVSCIPQKAGTPVGQIKNVRFSAISARSEQGIVVYGMERNPIRNLSFDGIALGIIEGRLNAAYGGNFDLRPAWDDEFSVFKHGIPGLYARYVDNLKIRDFHLEWGRVASPFFSHGIECEDFVGLMIDGFSGRQALLKGDAAAISLSHGRDVTIRNCRAAPGTLTFLAHADLSDPRLFAGNDLANVQTVMRPADPGFAASGNLEPPSLAETLPGGDTPDR